MEISEKWVKEHGGARISFKTDGPTHTVKLVKEKEDVIPDGRGGNVKVMRYLVEEDGKQKTIATSSIGLIAKLAKCAAGDVVTITLATRNNKSFYTVTKGGAEVGEPVEPVVELDMDAPEEPGW